MSLDRWNRDHQLGLLAHALAVMPVAGPGSGRFEATLWATEERLLHEVPDANARRQQLHRLPLSVLRLVRRAVSERHKVGADLAAILPDVDKAIDRLTKEADHPFWNRVQIWVYHCLLSSVDAPRLLRFGRVLFGLFAKPPMVSWRSKERDQAVIDRVEAGLKSLRDPWSDTAERLSGVDEMRSALSDAVGWEHIENLLYHSLYYWPLLVVPLDHESHELGLSLPIAIDVTLGSADGWNRVAWARPMRVTPRTGNLLVDGWFRHLARSTRAGKKLWRAKHGNYGEFRRQVLNAIVRFDFAAAEAQAQVLRNLAFDRIALDGGSAEAYLAQAVLNRLLGRSTVLASAATGAIGKVLHREDGTSTLNYEIVPVGSVSAKLQYVFDSEAFERVVVPATDDHIKPPKHQSAEVIRAVDLHTMADAVQTQGWRQHNYVRCPDIMWAVQSERLGRPGLMPKAHPKVRETLEQLGRSTAPIVRSAHNSAIAVVSALWHINELNRALDPAPPGISWAVIRCVEFEQDVRFWQTLWDISGARPRSIYELAQHPTRRETVERVAALLNRFAPDEANPSLRAPDVLVVVGLNALTARDEIDLTPSSRPHKVSEVLSDPLLGDLLQPVPDERIVDRLGQTRIVVLEGEDDEFELERENVQPDFTNEREIETLRTLATFTYGFTHHMAAVALGEDAESNLKETLLKDLEERGLLREGQGRYHVPSFLRIRLKEQAKPTDNRRQRELRRTTASRHFRAGCALAPYADDKRVSGLALDVAFRPEYVHEASRQLKLAMRHADDGDLRTSIQKVHGRVTRFAEMPTWGVVDNLLQAKNLATDAYEMASDLLEWQAAGGVAPHPNHLICAARAAHQWAIGSRGLTTKEQELYDDLVLRADRLYKEAIDRCKGLPNEEIGISSVQALTARAMFLRDIQVSPDGEREREFADLTKAAIRLLEDGVNPRLARGDWCELATDAEPDNAKAVRLYSLVLTSRQEWAQLWVKGLGSALLAADGAAAERIRSSFAEKTKRDRSRGWDLSQKARLGWIRQLADDRPWVLARWRAGFQAFGIDDTRITDQAASDERNHRDAARMYAAILDQNQNSSELWVKGVGAVVLAGDSVLLSKMEATLRSKDEMGWTIQPRPGWRAHISSTRPWIKARWRAGLDHLRVSI